MYRVTVVTDGKEYVLLNKQLRLIDPKLEEHAGNTPNYFKFKIDVNHLNYDKINPLTSVFYVYEDNIELFRGRAINSEEDFYRTHNITCESDLAYFLDSIVRPFSFTGDIDEFVEFLLDNHNSQVEDFKRFEKGIITVVDGNNYINRSSIDYSNTLDVMRNKLVKTHDGYFRTRYEDKHRYLDYVVEANVKNRINTYAMKVDDRTRQTIQFGVNLQQFTRTKDATSIFTVLIPIGARITETASDGTEIERVVDITSVNDGKDYIEDEEAIAKYGRIVKVVEWEDVTLPQNLLLKASHYLSKSLYFSDTITLSAVDLALIDSKYEHFQVGQLTRVVSKPHGIDLEYMLEERTLYLQEPSKSTITLGAKRETLSSYTNKTNNQFTEIIDDVATHTSDEINRRVDNGNKLITGGLGGYVVFGLNDDNKPEEILIMDADNKDNAKNVIRINKNGIGFSNSGYDGYYKNAWTIDGNLVADFVTTGTMLAERIRGGTLEVGGSGLGKDGEIVVKNTKNKELVKLDKNGMTLDSSVKIAWNNVENADANVNTMIDDELSSDDTKNMITSISENTIKTTNVIANNLKVKSANIEGTLIADKISGGTLKGVVVESEDRTNVNKVVINYGQYIAYRKADDIYKEWCYFGWGKVDNEYGTLVMSKNDSKFLALCSSTGAHLIINDGWTVDGYSDKVYIFGGLQVQGHINLIGNRLYFFDKPIGQGQSVSSLGFGWWIDGSASIYADSHFWARGEMGATDFTYLSDRNLKHDIHYLDIERGVISTESIFDEINPCTYVLNDDENEKVRFGFIAQDIEEALQKANIENQSIVKTVDDGKKGVSDVQLLPILWSEVKRLKRRVEELENNK